MNGPVEKRVMDQQPVLDDEQISRLRDLIRPDALAAEAGGEE